MRCRHDAVKLLEVIMKKLQKSRLVRLGRVSKETRAIWVNGAPEFGSETLHYPM
jgi:isoprenylcysteine carboxyl methyltransferase (ICMT) family protein YpbQ